MKSERRHELEKNVLADRVGAGLESVHSYWPMILGGLAILVVGSLAWGLYSSSARKQAAEAWTDYYFSMAGGEAEAFLDLSERYPNSSAAGWARQTAGNGFLERGVDALYVNKSEGESLIKQAISEFEQLEDSSNQELRAKALYGLAQAHESLGDLDTAIAYYEKLMKATPREALLRSASERLAFLNSDSGKEFYAWFGTLDPKPDAPIDLPSNLNLPPLGPGGMSFGLPTDGPAGSETPVTPPPATDLPESNAPVQVPAEEGVSVPPAPAGPSVVPTAETPAANVPPAINEVPPASEPASAALELEPSATAEGADAATAGDAETTDKP